MEKQEIEHTMKSAKILALKALARQNLPKVLLSETLIRKGVSKDLAESAALECEKEGWVDDRAWVEGFIRRQKARKDGPRAIFYKLKQKGIDEELINELLYANLSQDEQQEQIKAVIATRSKSKNLKEFKEKQKLIASLMRKGHSYSNIQECLES